MQALLEENARLLALLRTLEWQGGASHKDEDESYRCPSCTQPMPSERDPNGGHAADCALACALADAHTSITPEMIATYDRPPTVKLCGKYVLAPHETDSNRERVIGVLE